MKDIEIDDSAENLKLPLKRGKRVDKQVFAVVPEKPFLAWHFRRSTAITIMNFLIGFFVAWIMCMAAFRYVFSTLFSV